MSTPTIILNNGKKIPVLGLGTWQGGVSISSIIAFYICHRYDNFFKHGNTIFKFTLIIHGALKNTQYISKGDILFEIMDFDNILNTCSRLNLRLIQ